MKLHHFKNMWQVPNDYGYVKFQSHIKTEAEWYLDTHKHSGEVLQRVSQHRGYTMKHINIYPNW